jgi:hypothetical protein
MTFDHKELSEKLVELGYATKAYELNDDYSGTNRVFLTQDIGKMATLAIENSVDLSFDVNILYVIAWTEKNRAKCYYADHNNDKVEATCIAIAKAVAKLKE